MTDTPEIQADAALSAQNRLKAALGNVRPMLTAIALGPDDDTIYAVVDGKYEMPTPSVEPGYVPVDGIDLPALTSDWAALYGRWQMQPGTWALPEDPFVGLREAFGAVEESAERATGMYQRIAATWGNTPPQPEEDPHDARRRPGQVPKPSRTPPMWADVPGSKRGRNQRRQTRIR